ncbi:hypothetical protein R0135_05765 [Congregibacter variabilis]|uniref:PEP-CTERM protein-sorting domain-containing protein n=1 Tax=Congregibacter variabilis TaxID=3081200 RepID=A0ABZ0I6L6_9GAMM|nr:hypothetical protein R0135_05765 [Congregibacter sp. IMCC43200]
MSRRSALKRQRKLIVTVAVAGVTVLLTLVYAVAAPASQPSDKRVKPDAAVNNTPHDVDHSLHSIRSGTGQTTTASVRSTKESKNSDASAVLEELAGDDTYVSPATEARQLPGSSELLAGLNTSEPSGVRASGFGRGTRVSAGRGGTSRGNASGLSGFGGGSAAGFGGTPAPSSFGGESLFGDLEVASAFVTTADDASGPGGSRISNFRPGAPLPIAFDPCLRDGLVVSPCVRTSSELLRDLESPSFSSGPGEFGDLPQTRIVFFSSPAGQSEGGGASGGDGSTGGDSGTGSNDPANSESRGGGGFYPEESATPVPAPAPVLLLSVGLMLLLSRRRV